MEYVRIGLSLFTLTVCLALFGTIGFCLVRGRQLRELFTVALGVSVGLLLVVALVLDYTAADPGGIPAWNQLGIIFALAAWPLLYLGGRLFPTACLISRMRVLAAASLALLAAAAGDFYSSTTAEALVLPTNQIAVKVPVTDAVLITDQGRIFSVFRYSSEGTTYRDKSPELFPGKLVQVAAADLGSNCHGWVFASGRYALPESAVAALLQDNGYLPVPEPQRDDVIVYFGENGKILHSGRIHRVHDDGQVWIESKWGPGGRYLHRPENQCYSTSYAYFRSKRPTHDAQIVQTKATKDDRLARSERLPKRPQRS